MKSITFRCNKCSLIIDVDNSLANQLIDCPSCGNVIEVPTRSGYVETYNPLELITVCESIISDGELTGDEVYALAEWLNNHREACEKWPGNQLVKPLQEVWADGKITKPELKRIGKLLIQIVQLWAQLKVDKRSIVPSSLAEIQRSIDLSTARLPLIPVRIRVQSHSDFTSAYDVDLSGPSCSCPDWVGKRKKLPAGHLSRCCKHVLDAYNQTTPAGGWPGWVGAFFRMGWKPHPLQEWRILNGGDGYVLYSSAPSGWADVYAESEGHLCERFGYNVNENRWSYGEKPENSNAIACAVVALTPCAKSNCYPRMGYVEPKGVLPKGNSTDNWLQSRKRVKTSRGAAVSLSSRPPAVEYPRRPWRGSGGGRKTKLFTISRRVSFQ